MKVKQLVSLCLVLILWNGCEDSEFFLKREVSVEKRVEEVTAPYFFSRSVDVLEGGPWVLPEYWSYREVLQAPMESEKRRNHTNFEEGRQKIVVNALELVWEDESEWIQESSDIHTLTFNAKTVKILRPLRVPGADVEINAEVLEVGPDGLVDITPDFQKNRPEKAGEPGEDGESAGRIILNVDTLINRVSEGPIFIARGGRGQNGSLGRNGRDGKSVPTIGEGGIVYREMVNCTSDLLGHELVRVQDFDCHTWKKEGQEEWPENGEDAVSGGRPGNSGDGGDIFTNVVLKSWEVDVSPGDPGKTTPAYRGGAAGTPQTAYASVRDFSNPKGSGVKKIVSQAQAGKNAMSLEADVTVAKAGRVIPLKRPEGSWVTPGYIKMLQEYAEDNYLAHSFERAAEIYQESLKILKKDEDEYNLLALNAQFQLQKLHSHRDIFFRRANSLPDFYFYHHDSVARSEIEQALELLYRIRSALKGNVEAHTVLVNWASRKKEKERRNFQIALKKGQDLEKEWRQRSLPSPFSDEKCKKENLASPQIFSTLFKRTQDEWSLLSSLLEETEGLTDQSLGTCQKMNVEQGEWVIRNRMQQDTLLEVAMESIGSYLSFQKMVFQGEFLSKDALKTLEREAMKSLLRHYTDAAKSYQYYHLTPWRGFFPWKEILSEVDKLVEKGRGDWRELGAFYWAELKKIFRPELSLFLTDKVSIPLSLGQREQIRRKERLYLNVLDGAQIYKGRKGVKIQNIEFRIEGEYQLTATHPRRFYIQEDDKTYYFEMSMPTVWKSKSPIRHGKTQMALLDIFEHTSPVPFLPGGLTQLIVESTEGQGPLEKVVLDISYQYHP